MSRKGKNLALVLLAVPAAIGLWVIGFAVSFAMPSKGPATKPDKKATDLLAVGELWSHGSR